MSFITQAPWEVTMKINRKILSIPPHISTTWKNVASLHIQEDETLVITLENESIIEIPGLDRATLEHIFFEHSKSLEQEEVNEEDKNAVKPTKLPFMNPFALPLQQGFSFSLPINQIAELDSAMGLQGITQHDMQKANTPSLPKELMDKVLVIAKAVGLDKQLQNLPKAEPHCNCPFCQVARAVHNEASSENKEEPKEESFDPDAEVSDAELTFKEWDVKQVNTDIYEVSNPLDKTETYQVFLGKSVGCNCGNSSCEHIKAVLNS